MLTEVHPKLPMRSKTVTYDFYVNKLGFEPLGKADFDAYLMVRKDAVELHFFSFPDLDINANDGQVYIRTNNITELYKSMLADNIEIHPNGPLQLKPWGQLEFSILDPNNNLLTFGQAIE